MNNGENKPLTSEQAAAARYPAIAAGYKHAEAFNLMWYTCVRRPGAPKKSLGTPRFSAFDGCGHNELIWNSRDGVTPFGLICPSCGGDLVHTARGSDRFVPDYQPRYGQKVWTTLTRERAKILAIKRLEQARKFNEEQYPGQPLPSNLTLENLIEEIYEHGVHPMLAVAGADWFPPGEKSKEDQLREVRDAQGQPGNWDNSEYMRGLYNGLELGVSILEGREPEYKGSPNGEG